MAMIKAIYEYEEKAMGMMDGFPVSVITTVIWTMRKFPESKPVLEKLLANNATPREMVKAVQPYLKTIN